jgi:hypothetical protein
MECEHSVETMPCAFSRERGWFSCYGIANTQLVSDASTARSTGRSARLDTRVSCGLRIGCNLQGWTER